MEMEGEPSYTLRVAADRFAVGRSTLHRWTQKGWLVPMSGKGRSRLVTEAQVQEARQLAADEKSEQISQGVRRTMSREQAELVKALAAARARIAELEAFVEKIADGKRLSRRSWMTMNNNCEGCGAEELACVDGEDDLQHKEWCVVLAARRLLPDFVPSHYPEDMSKIRRYGNKDDAQWRW